MGVGQVLDKPFCIDTQSGVKRLKTDGQCGKIGTSLIFFK